MELRFQDLSTFHQQLFSRLLSADFSGKEQLSQQIESARFAVIDANQSLKIHASGPRAKVLKRVPVEAHGVDRDGMPIQCLLFTRDGYAYMLENFREDGNAIQRLPSASTFQVLVLPDAKEAYDEEPKD